MWRNNHDKSRFAAHFFFPSEYAPHIWWGVCCRFLLLGINSSGKKCGFLSVEVTNLNPANLQLSALLFCTSQGQCSSQMGLAARFPSLHSYLQRVMSSRCKPQAPAPEKKLRSGRWLHQKDGLAKCYYQCQMFRSFPHTCSISHHSRSCSLTLSIVRTFITLLSHSFKVSPFHSHADIFSLVYFLCYRFLCHSEGPQILKPARLSKGTSVRVMSYHHQS